MISENIEELSNSTHFFRLTLINIFSVISYINYDCIQESDDIIETIFQKNMIVMSTVEKRKHFNY